ncbi:MAG: hypothetical protein WCG23_12515 [bacterium]
MTNNEYKKTFEISKIFNRAVKKAQEENRRQGIPNVYSINGKIVFELPDGQLKTEYQF